MPTIIIVIIFILFACLCDTFYDFFGKVMILIGVVVLIYNLRVLKMSEAEWLQEEGKKSLENPNHKIASKPQKSVIVFYIVIAFIMGIGGYKLIDYSDEVVAQENVASLEALNTKISRFSESEKVIFDSFYDPKWNGSNFEKLYKQEAYDKTTAKIKAEKDEQQKKYDDQAKYEEWVQWQADQELQKKYDDQAKYEEWMKWKADEERKSAEKAIAEQEKREKERNKYEEVSIYTLQNQLETNAARAQRNWKGKYVRIVGGVVKSIESSARFVNIDVPDGYGIKAVTCIPKNDVVKKDLYNINTNQYVTVVGQITDVGEILGYTVQLHSIK